jgi:hypothetical protein
MDNGIRIFRYGIQEVMCCMNVIEDSADRKRVQRLEERGGLGLIQKK